MKAVCLILLQAMLVLRPAWPLETGIDKGTLFCSRERGNSVIHVEKGDHGEIVSGDYPGNYSTGGKSGLWCQVHIKGCSTCRLQLKFQELSFADCYLKNSKRNKQDKNWCHHRCDHIHVHEVDAPYRDVTHENFFWEDEGRDFTSISSNVKIRHCAAITDPEDGSRFKIEYNVIDKTEIFQGVVSPYDKGGVLTSPNFPNGYALNGETFTFMIQNLDPYGHIRLVFDDWDIAPESQVKVYDGVQDNAPHSLLLAKSRPVLVSKSNTLVIILSTGKNHHHDCCFYRGFKAHYKYVSESSWGKHPDVNCSEVFPMQGGALFSFTGASISEPRFYDCVWLIKRKNSMDGADGVVLRVEEVLLGDGWLQFGRGNALEIRDGITSEAPLLAKYTAKNLTDISYKFFSQHGLYIRLTGGYYSTDKLSFIYTAVKNVTKGEGCTGYFDFLCNTMVCIDQALVCDGLNHCGDNSDESPSIDCSASSMWRHKFEWDKMPYLASDRDKSSPGPVCDGIWCGHNCIRLDQICDGRVDCVGREDEDKCVNQVPSTTVKPSSSPRQCSVPSTYGVLSVVVFIYIILTIHRFDVNR